MIPENTALYFQAHVYLSDIIYVPHGQSQSCSLRNKIKIHLNIFLLQSIHIMNFWKT